MKYRTVNGVRIYLPETVEESNLIQFAVRSIIRVIDDELEVDVDPLYRESTVVRVPALNVSAQHYEEGQDPEPVMPIVTFYVFLETGFLEGLTPYPYHVEFAKNPKGWEEIAVRGLNKSLWKDAPRNLEAVTPKQLMIDLIRNFRIFRKGK